ncbi:plu, partial [Drosophila busckii]
NVAVFNCVSYNDVISLRNICMLARKHQYNLEELDKFGNTPLLKACYLGRLECVCILLEFGADIYTINYFGQNALTLATYGGYFPIVLELLQRRSYQDFNLSSLIPAICVATMRQHYALEDYFMRLDQNSTQEIHTVHGM